MSLGITSSRSPPPVRLVGRWAALARAAWVVALVIYITLWALGSYERLFGPKPDCASVICDNIEFSAGDVKVLAQLNLPPLINPFVWQSLEVPYSVGIFLIAGLIFWRRSDHAVGLLLSFTLVYLGAMLFSAADDPLKRAYPELRSLVSFFDILGLTSLVLVLLTFPDGRILGRRLPLVTAGFVVIVLAVPLITAGSSRLQGPEIPPIATALWMMLFIVMIGIGLTSQVHRYRHVSSQLQRQQTKWVLFGLAGYLVMVPLWGYIGYAYPPSEPSPARVRLVLLALPVILGLSALVPLSVAFAILRYRLFDIDRIINRALVYAILTGLLALMYISGVVLLQGVSVMIGLGRSPLAVVLSTLAIATLFSPLRRRVQLFIDRRFYRRRYDIEQTLAAFGSQMRKEFEVVSLLNELLSVTEETLQPEHISIWLKEPNQDNSDRTLDSFVKASDTAA